MPLAQDGIFEHPTNISYNLNSANPWLAGGLVFGHRCLHLLSSMHFSKIFHKKIPSFNTVGYSLVVGYVLSVDIRKLFSQHHLKMTGETPEIRSDKKRRKRRKRTATATATATATVAKSCHRFPKVTELIKW